MPPLRPSLAALSGFRKTQLGRKYAQLSRGLFSRSCSCSAPAAAPASSKPSPRKLPSKQPASNSTPPLDHHELARAQNLFIASPYSPGSPLFTIHGAQIFTKLQEFMRKQYALFGFREVVTPTIYKKSLWETSGHWENYAEHMYRVTGHGASRQAEGAEPGEDEEFGLKSMNCPGHCLLFADQVRSYRELPVRFADFSALHRNEASGALTGLTRVRRFHQDDAHIFCRPAQIQEEILQTLKLLDMVYSVFGLNEYSLVLSTRPEDHFIGTIEDWNKAEDQLKAALDASGQEWTLNEGDGAFYGPKIDIRLKDANGKEHQTATIQLDFQLPQRFNLQYRASPEELELDNGATQGLEYGNLRPVIIHRAIFGSLERFMAILIEHFAGKYPFWMAPRQAIILSINTHDPVVAHIATLQKFLSVGRYVEEGAPDDNLLAGNMVPINVDVDVSARPLGKKMREARELGYNHIIVVGPEDVNNGTMSLHVANQYMAERSFEFLEQLNAEHLAKREEKKREKKEGEGYEELKEKEVKKKLFGGTEPESEVSVRKKDKGSAVKKGAKEKRVGDAVVVNHRLARKYFDKLIRRYW